MGTEIPTQKMPSGVRVLTLGRGMKLGGGTGAWKSSLAISPKPNSANTELTSEPISSFLSQNPQRAAWLVSSNGDSHGDGHPEHL